MANAPHDRHSSTLVGPQTSAHGGAEVEPAAHTAVVAYNPDAPSEEWGWHGSWRHFAPRGSRLLLWLGVVGLLLMNYTTHVSHVEDYYITGTAVLMAIWLVSREVAARKERLRRKQ